MDIITSFKILRDFIRFRKEVKSEAKDPESGFCTHGLMQDKFGMVLYKQYDFDDSDFMSSDYNQEKMVMTRVNKVLEYFGEMGWDNLVLSIGQFYDDDDIPTKSFAVVFKYDGINEAVNSIIKWILSGIGVVCVVGIVCGLLFVA